MHATAPRIIRHALAAALAFACLQAAAQTAEFDIPAQPLPDALAQFARQSGAQIVYAPELVRGLRASAVRGPREVQAALAALLRGTGLQLRRDGATLVLERVPGQADAALREVTVTAEAEREWAAGPVRGYVARRSATGTRTDASILETPQSVTVIGAQEIETLKSQSLQDALGYAAGVARAEGLDRTSDSFFLRGFRTDMGSIYRDGSLYTVNIYNGRQEPYGLERIELLKGAASVLYGAAAPGGIINTVSKRPTTAPLREINLEAGSFGRRQAAGDFGGALGAAGDWSYRLTVLRRSSDTFIDRIPDDRTYIAPALAWRPSAATSLTLLAEYQKDRTVYADGLPAQGTLLPNANGRIPRHRFTGEPGFDRFEVERYSVGYLFEHAFSDHWKLRHNLRYFDADNVYNYTWGWALAGDQRSTLFRGANQREDHSSALVTDTSLQYQGQHGGVQHTVLVGIDHAVPRHASARYSRSAASLDLFAPVYGSPLGVPTENAGSSWRSEMRRLGLYAQDQIKLAERWSVLLGGRYDSIRYEEREYFSGAPIADNEKSHAFSGRAGLVYLADNGLAPFLSYSESFEPTSGRDRAGRRFEPTTGRQVEAGLRYQPAGSETLLSAALYQLTRDNATVTDPADTNYLVQHGRVRSRGVELEARSRVGRNTQLIAAYAYTDARTLQASPLQPEQVGQRVNSVPFHQLSLWGDYDFGAFGLPGLQVGAGLRHVGSTRGMAQGTAVQVPAFTLLDAMLRYSVGPWTWALNIHNLADKTYIGSCTYACFYGEPRKLIGTASYRW